MIGFVKVGPIVGKLLIFEVFYEFKKLKITFIFVLSVATTQGTLVLLKLQMWKCVKWSTCINSSSKLDVQK